MLNYSIILDLLELTAKKKKTFFFFHHRDWSAKVGSQEIPGGIVKFGLGVQNKSREDSKKVLPGECTVYNKHCYSKDLPTTQETTLHMDITRRSI